MHLARAVSSSWARAQMTGDASCRFAARGRMPAAMSAGREGRSASATFRARRSVARRTVSCAREILTAYELESELGLSSRLDRTSMPHSVRP